MNSFKIISDPEWLLFQVQVLFFSLLVWRALKSKSSVFALSMFSCSLVTFFNSTVLGCTLSYLCVLPPLTSTLSLPWPVFCNYTLITNILGDLFLLLVVATQMFGKLTLTAIYMTYPLNFNICKSTNTFFLVACSDGYGNT